MGRTDVQPALFAIIHQKGISIAQKQIASKPLTLDRLFPLRLKLSKRPMAVWKSVKFGPALKLIILFFFPIAVNSPILIGIAKISSPAKSMKKQFVLLQAYHQPRQILNFFSTWSADIGVLKIKAIMFVM